jgi:hypothetical protein
MLPKNCLHTHLIFQPTDAKSIEMGVAKVKIHKQYDDYTTNNDIALIKLSPTEYGLFLNTVDGMSRRFLAPVRRSLPVMAEILRSSNLFPPYPGAGDPVRQLTWDKIWNIMEMTRKMLTDVNNLATPV